MIESLPGLNGVSAGVGCATELPQPDSRAMDHSNRLRALLAHRMDAAGGLLPFSEYMTAALYEPGLGYYMAGAAMFGAGGDFITAPEVTPLFGQSLAVQIRQIMETTGGGILELGAGSGKLALSLIQSLQAGQQPGSDFQYSILEPSAALAQRQQQLLAANLNESLMDSISWLDKLPDKHTGVIVANEVMDALPVERFRATAGGSLSQQFVSSRFESRFLPADQAMSESVRDIESDIGCSFSDGYESEVCMVLKPWVHSMADCLVKGVILLADYGYPRREYYLSERINGTLACYYQHRMHADPYHLIGLQDITAHVDFTAVAEAAVSAELDLLGYASQSAFLLDNDLLVLADRQLEQTVSETQRISMARSIKVLTMPGEMGERFQVMALGKGYDAPLRGFRSQDLTYRL